VLPGIMVSAVMEVFCDDDETQQVAAQSSSQGHQERIAKECEIPYSQAAALGALTFNQRYDRCRYARPPTGHMWACIAANRNRAEAQDQMAKLHFWGSDPAEKDLVEAYKWSKLAANNQEDYTAESIALIEPKLTPEQIAEADRLVAEFEPDPSTCQLDQAETGNGEAEQSFKLYVKTADLIERWTWLCRAAHQNHSKAQTQLGRTYQWGLEPAPKDTVLALMWYSLAEVGGNKDAPELKTRLSEESMRAQITKAERLASEWKPDPVKCEIQTAQVES
jgi:hypothetical protein